MKVIQNRFEELIKAKGITTETNQQVPVVQKKKSEVASETTEKKFKLPSSSIFQLVRDLQEFCASIVNGIVGDRLEAKGNALSIPMQFIHNYQPLPMNRAAWKAAFPQAKPKVCLFVHGLCVNEILWRFGIFSGKSYGSLLEEDLGYTSLYVRYNSGLHISHNGRRLAALIEELLKVYPVEIEDLTIIGHSLGGLVARSAGYYGEQRKDVWVQRLRRMFLLATPQLGAPFERFGNTLTFLLMMSKIPVLQSLGRFINLRSAAIKDLRYGFLIDEEWEFFDPDALLMNNRRQVPLLEGASHYVVAGTLTKNLRNPITLIFGDFWIRPDSAFGQLPQPEAGIPYKPENCKLYPGFGHIRLAHDPVIYHQIKTWCQSPTDSPALPIPSSYERSPQLESISNRGQIV